MTNTANTWEASYHTARIQGTPDFVTDFSDIDDALEAWGMVVDDVVRDGQDDVLALLADGGARAVAYLDAGCWCAYRITGAA